MSGLGTPSSRVDPEVARFWRAVKLLIEGNDPLVRRSAVTAAISDFGGTLTPTPGIIPAPTGLVATGLFAKILLEWNPPTDGGAYMTEVYRSQTDDLGTAVMVLRVPPELLMVVDDTLPEVSVAQTYYYWIRFASDTGVSLFNQAAGTAATTATDPAYILEILAGEITESELHSSLTSRIDLIDTPTTGLVAKMAAVESEIDTITTTLSELQNIPAYDNATTYALDDMVSYDGGLYRALQATTGNLPTNTTYWEKVGDYASLGEAVAAHAAQLSDHETRITDSEGDITAEATARETLATQMRGAYTGTDIASVTAGLLFSEKTARSSADSSEVTARQALSTKLTGVADPASKTLATLTSGLLYDEKTARSSADGAQVTRIEALETTVNDPTNGVSATASALDVVETTVNHPTTGVVATASGLSALSAQVNHATTGLPKAHALIAEEQTARADGDSAVATSVSTLAATVNAQADNLVNPLTKVGHGVGWSSILGAPETFDVGGRQGVGSLSSVSGNSVYYSDYFEIDPRGIYELRLSWYKADANSFTYVGLNTLPSTSVKPYNPDTGVLGAVTNNPYFYATQTSVGWRDMVAYIAGPYADLTLVPKQAENVNTKCFVVEPGQTQVRLRLLNGFYGNGTTPYVAWFTGVSVRNIAQSMTAAIRQESLVRAIATGPDWSSTTAYAPPTVVHYQGVLYQSILAGTNKVPPDQPTYWKAITNSLYAQYTVKTDVNGKVAGFGLANDGVTSIFEILADKFAICKTDGSGTRVPFVVDTTTGLVVMDIALIRELTSTNIKAGGIAADRLSVATLSALSAALGAITSGTITFANTASWMKSSGYVAGSAGFLIRGDGYAEFQNIKARGDVEASSLKADTLMVNTGNLVNLCVEEGKIKGLAVTELKIGDNAVTVTVSAKNTTGGNATVTATTMVSVSITVTNAQPVLLFLSVIVTGSEIEGGYSYPIVSVYRGATQLFSNKEENVARHIVSLNLYDAPGTGTFTYYFKIAHATSGGAAAATWDEAYLSAGLGKDNR